MLLKDVLAIVEAKNHMGDTEYSTYESWRKACRKAYPDVSFEGDKDIAQAMHSDGKHAVGEWDGSVGIVYKKPDTMKESAEYAKQLVRGEKAGPGLMNKLDQWISRMIVTKDANRFLPAESALKQLRKAGFNEQQITLIRDAAISACNTAVQAMNKKHGDDAIGKKYQSTLSTSFGVYDLFLNVSEKIRDEFAALMRKLFDAKIEEIKEKLVLVKEDTLTEAPKFALDDIAIGGTVIYKSIHDNCYKISKARKKNDSNLTVGLQNGDTIQNAAIVSTDTSDWKDFKDKKIEAVKKVREAKDDDECIAQQCHAKAAAKSKAEGVVQHVNKDKRTGKLYVSDWFDEEETTATYNKGKLKEGFGIKFNGKLIMNGDKPLTFASQQEANAHILKSPSMSAKDSKVVPLNESPELQALGKSLKTTKPVVVDDDDALEISKTDVNTPPGKKDKVAADADDADADDDAADEKVVFKVGDKVKPSVGPHKDVVHSVIHVFPDGRLNLKPDGLEASQIKYRQGAVTAKPTQVTLAESFKITRNILMKGGSMLSMFMKLDEVNEAADNEKR